MFSLFAPLVPRQDAVWMSPTIGFCVCDKNTNTKGIHTMGGEKAEHTHIPKDVISNLNFLHIGTPPCDPYMSTPPSGGSCFPC